MKPDALPHRVDHQPGEEDNQDQVMLSAKCFHLSQAKTSVDTSQQMPQPSESSAASRDSPSQVTIEGEGSTFLESVQDCANKEDSVVRALKELNTDKGLHCEEW